MAVVRTSTYQGPVTETVDAADAEVGGADAITGSGTATYVVAASGFSDATTVAQFVTAAGARQVEDTIAAWDAWAVEGEVRVPVFPDAGGGKWLQVAVGGTQIAAVRLSELGFPKIESTLGVGEETSEVVVPGGDVYKFLWQGDRVAGTQDLYIFTDDAIIDTLHGECGTTTGTLQTRDGIIGTTTFTVQLQNVVWYDALRTPPEPPPGLVCVRSTAPTTGGWTIITQTNAITDVRVKVYTEGTYVTGEGGVGTITPGSFLFTSAEVAVPVNGWTQIPIADALLEPFISYSWQIEGFDGVAWADIGAVGASHTLAETGTPAPLTRIATFGCERTGSGSGNFAWVHAREQFQPHFQVQLGDEDYSNYKGSVPSVFLDKTSETLTSARGQEGMQPAYREIQQLWSHVSDHDGGDGNNGFGSPSCETCAEAWIISRGVASLVPALGGTIGAKGKVGVAYHGRWQLIFGPDMRTTERDDPMGADGPGKFCIPQEQEDWLIDLLETHHLTGGVSIIFTDSPWVGLATDQDVGVPKEDHWARYPNQRARIDAVLATVNAVAIFGDYHAGAATSRFATQIDGITPKHACRTTWFCCNGTTADGVGNTRDPQNYEQVWDPGTDRNLYTQVILTDDGTTMTVQMNGIEARFGGETVLSMTDAWTDGVEVPPGEQAPTYEVITLLSGAAGVPLTFDPVSDMPWGLARDGLSLGLGPAKDVATASAHGIDGEWVGDDMTNRGDDMLLRHVVFGTKAERKSRVAKFKGLWGNTTRTNKIQWAPTQNESALWEAEVIAVASSATKDDGALTWFDVIPRVHSGKWRTVGESAFTYDVPNDVINEVTLEGLRSSRASIDDAIIRVRGGFGFINVTDERSGNGFHWETGGAPVPAGSYAIIVCKSWDVYVVDHDTWKTTTGTLYTNADHWGAGSSLLTLVPDIKAAGIDAWKVGVMIKVGSPDVGVCQVEIRVKGATFEPSEDL